MFVSQLTPVNPTMQVHAYMLSRSAHVPPLRHGFDAHSLMSVSQCLPV